MLTLSKPAALAACAQRMAQAHAPSLALWQAAARGEINLVVIEQPPAKWPAKELALSQRPVVALIADDHPGRPSAPPSAWKCLSRLARWHRGAVVHGSGGTVSWPYRLAVETALMTGRTVVVETNGTHAPAWTKALGGGLVILPEGPHPVAASVH